MERLPSAALVVSSVQRRGSGRALDRLSEALRALPLPVIGRVQDDRLWLDVRCLEADADFVGQLPQLQNLLV